MKRLIVMMLMLATLCTLAACGNNSVDPTKDTTPVTVDIAAVKAQILNDVEIVDPLDLTTERACVQYYLDASDVKNSACMVAMGGAFPEEILMFEATDAEAAARIAEKLQAKLQDLLNQSANYDADTNALLKECKVETVGNYVTLFIHAKHAQMREIFNAAKK